MASQPNRSHRGFVELSTILAQISHKDLKGDVRFLVRIISEFQRVDSKIDGWNYAKALKYFQNNNPVIRLSKFWKKTHSNWLQAWEAFINTNDDEVLSLRGDLNRLKTATDVAMAMMLDSYIKAENGESKWKLRHNKRTAQAYLRKAKRAYKKNRPLLAAFYKDQAARYGASQTELSKMALPGEKGSRGAKRQRQEELSIKASKKVVLTGENNVQLATSAVPVASTLPVPNSSPRVTPQVSVAERRRAGKQDYKPAPIPLSTVVSTQPDVSPSDSDSGDERTFQEDWKALDDLCIKNQHPKRSVQKRILVLVNRLRPEAQRYYRRAMADPGSPKFVRALSPTTIRRLYPELPPLLQGQSDVQKKITKSDAKLQKLILDAGKYGAGGGKDTATKRMLQLNKLAQEKVTAERQDAVQEKERIENDISIIMVAAVGEEPPEEAPEVPEEPEHPMLGFNDDTEAILAWHQLQNLKELMRRMLFVREERLKVGYHQARGTRGVC